MKEIAERIKKLRSELGMTQSEFARRLGISQRALSHYERGDRQIPLNLIQKILKEFPEVNPLWLLEGRGDMFDEERAKYVESIEKRLAPGKVMRVKWLPIVGYVSAGLPERVEEQRILGWIPVPESQDGDMILHVNGDSMEPTVPMGSMVVVKRVYSPFELRDGNIVVVRLDGDHTLKRIFVKGNKIILKPENPKYQPIEVSIEDFNVVVEGKVVLIISGAE